MLLLAQEFDMNNVIKMWDTVLSDHDRFTFVNFICVAMVVNKRDYLMKLNGGLETIVILFGPKVDSNPQPEQLQETDEGNW